MKKNKTSSNKSSIISISKTKLCLSNKYSFRLCKYFINRRQPIKLKKHRSETHLSIFQSLTIFKTAKMFRSTIKSVFRRFWIRRIFLLRQNSPLANVFLLALLVFIVTRFFNPFSSQYKKISLHQHADWDSVGHLVEIKDEVSFSRIFSFNYDRKKSFLVVDRRLLLLNQCNS